MTRRLWIVPALIIACVVVWAPPRLVPSTVLARPLPGQQQVSAVISGTGGRQTRMALPDFIVTGGDADLKAASEALNDVLTKDLEFESEFFVIDRKASAAIPPTDVVENLPVDRWAEAGADYVILGTVRRTDADFAIDLRVISVRSDSPRKQVHGMSYSPCRVAAPRGCAHFIADDLHKKLAGIQGVAQSIVAFASDRDGERLTSTVVRNVKEIYLADYDGANQRRVTVNQSLNLSPSLTSDGQYLAYVSYTTGFNDIYIQPTFRVGSRTKPAGGTAAIQNQGPAFSPDGARIAFSSTRDGNSEIYVVDRDGKSAPVRLTRNPGIDVSPAWSPTGSQIAFISGRTGLQKLYQMTADGLAPEVMADLAADHPSWSPLGDKIAFTCGTSSQGPFDVCVVDVRTRVVAKLTDGPGSNEQPTFAPNGRHVVFVTTRYGKKQLAIVDLKGKLQMRLTTAGNNDFPTWSLSAAVK